MAARHPVKPLMRTPDTSFSITRRLYGEDRIPRGFVWALFAVGLATPLRAALRHDPWGAGTVLALLASLYAARMLVVDYMLAAFAKRR